MNPEQRMARRVRETVGRIRAERAIGVRELVIRLQRGRPSVVFQSWDGTYSDNPRALYEELLQRGASLDFVWVSTGGPGSMPAAHPRTRVVRRGSLGHLRALGACSYLVMNGDSPRFFRKRRHTTFLQTWHGTPLKRIGLDIEMPRFDAAGKYLSGIPAEAAKWDYLLSSNELCSEVFPGAFGYAGPLLEVGTPRNDVLVQAPTGVRERVLDELGIGHQASSQVFLFAPTWRDDEDRSTQLDLGVDLGRLCAAAPDAVILLRLHPSMRNRLAGVDLPPGVVDVSEVDDIAHLYLAADALITDYSSAMFDFAVTGKPVLLFVHDLEHYRRRLRGFYFDLESLGPGPLLHTEEELLQACAALSEYTDSTRAQYAAFRERFCAWEDGRASARTVDAVFRRHLPADARTRTGPR